MGTLIGNYFHYIRGENGSSSWKVLAPLGWLVGACSGVRNFSYDHGLAVSSETPVPVVSIGNITHGGTNKTPFVEMLVRTFMEAGLSPGIIMRGYGRRGKESLFVGESPPSRELLGDEALLLAGKLPGVPIAVAAERMSGVERLAARGAGLVVADDGFQHRRMGRDVDIVLVDATCPFGNGRLMPAGMLREPLSSLKRAHMVVVSKADQVPFARLKEIEKIVLEITGFTPFRATLELAGWSRLSANGSTLEDSPPPELPAAAFSAIGNPDSFSSFLTMLGTPPLFHTAFIDHHRYTPADLEGICGKAIEKGAGTLVCTEKDIFNIPPGWIPPMPIFVPKVRASVHEPGSFRSRLLEHLRPRFVVASNGHGEDAIGSLLAERLKFKFPLAEVSGFSLVGRGREYKAKDINVVSPPSETPSGGVVKYSVRDLMRDIRSGLFRHISDQASAWSLLRGNIRTVICVGDVYLLLHTLWGQGARPALLATAKSVRLHGHWKLEEILLRSRCRRVWARDQETASSLSGKNIDAVYDGNPIMDLAGDTINKPGKAWENRILLLPGSRERAYDDLRILLEASALISREEQCSFVMVVAATLELERLLENAPGWVLSGDGSVRHPSGSPEIRIFFGDLAEAASNSDILVGLGGTANQICAGLGLPIVSIDEKGKRVQKKLLGEAESLVPSDPVLLAGETLNIIRDPVRREKMSITGKERMGRSGAISSVVEYVSGPLGWSKRHALYEAFSSFLDAKGEKMP